MMIKTPSRATRMPAWTLHCLLICVSGCAATPPPIPVPTLPPMPVELQPTPVADCDPADYRAALACALRWRTGWREAEADKAAARELWLIDPTTPKEPPR